MCWRGPPSGGWADRCTTSPTATAWRILRLEPDPAADAVRFARLPVAAAEQHAALAGIDTVFDRLAAQMDQSLREMEVTRTAS